MNYSIIIPLYNEEPSVDDLNIDITKVIEQNLTDSRNFELIYVEDGSSDDTYNKLLKLEKKKFKIKIIKNKRNYSQSVSIFHGIQNSSFDNLIFLDGDGQNDPNDISKMIIEYEKGYDLVHGIRKERKDNFITKTIPSILGNFLVRTFTNSKIRDHGCSLKIIKKKFLDDNILWGDFHRLLAARLTYEYSNIKISQMEINHKPRIHGKSNYGFYRIFKVFIDLIYLNLFYKTKIKNFYIIGLLGLISILFGILSAFYMFFLKIFKNVSFVETPLPTVILLFFISSLIFFSFMFIIQSFINISNEKRDDSKNFDVVEK